MATRRDLGRRYGEVTSERLAISIELSGYWQHLAMTTLAIVESNRTKAELLCHYLTTRCGYEVVAMEYCAASAFRAVERCKPEVILASLTMPDLSATEMIAQLRSAASAARIIGLVSRCSEYLVHSLTRTGYQALFCDTDEGLAGLLQTIDHVLRGRRVVSASIVNCQLGLRSAPAAFPKLLSNRELEALICIAHSMTDEEHGRSRGFRIALKFSR